MTKTHQPFILLIMNCQKYCYKADYQRKTWLQDIPPTLLYYHVVGDESMEEAYHYDDDKHILSLKTPDDYCSLPLKVIRALEAIDKRFAFSFVFKTDDDQNLTNTRFFETIMGLLEKKVPSPDYGGKIVDVKHAYLSEYHRIHPELPPRIPIHKTKYCNGRFYFLSHSSVLDLLTKRENISQECLEDYAIGFHLSEAYKKNILEIKNDLYFKDITF